VPIAAWLTLGAVIGVVHLRCSQRLLQSVLSESGDQSIPKYPIWMLYVAAALGAATAVVVAESSSPATSAHLIVVSSLLLVQAPLDMCTRRLSRTVSSMALVAVVAIVMTTAIQRGEATLLLQPAAITILVVFAYTVVHRVSPASLGWGDVVLVAPLACALAAASPDRVIIWQLVSSLSGAVHGVLSRLARRGSNIAFGPHLLLAAWLVLVASV
jgi:prepilin signal peptidase PulO-like enzyme (type II secretory pathway)